MNINNIVELDNGKTVKFEGEITGVELEYIIKVGLNTLLYNGLLPVIKKDPNLHVPQQEFPQ